MRIRFASLSTRIRRLARGEDPNPTAATIVIEDGKALILKRGPTAPWYPNYWNLPGGGIDPGESPKAAAKRELEEEIGIAPRNIRFLDKVYDHKEDFTLWTYVAEGYRGRLLLDKSENTEYAWVGPEDISSYRFVPQVERLLQKVLRKAA